MRIGIFGGTFDPPHKGHLAVANACLQELQLDEVMFLPASRNPLKEEATVAPAKDRLNMVRLLTSGLDRMAASDIEITRGGKSYAVDTLSELQMAQPADYWFLLGADALKLLPTWKSPQRLMRLCRLGAVGRAGTSELDLLLRVPEEFREGIDVVKMNPIPVSSSEVRERILQGRDYSTLTTPAVAAYIREHKLYKN